jgi:hypothetical protein
MLELNISAFAPPMSSRDAEMRLVISPLDIVLLENLNSGVLISIGKKPSKIVYKSLKHYLEVKYLSS